MRTQVTVEDLSADVRRQLPRRMRDAMHALTTDATNEAVDLVTRNTVTHGNTGEFLGRSKPGQPPFQDTSRLADSIPEARAVRVQGNLVVGVIGSTVAYAVHLELGTRHMSPRPFLRPAMNAMARRADRTLRRVFSAGGV